MPVFRCDLHVHSPASHCFSEHQNSIPAIIAEAKRKKLHILGIADHHSFSGFPELQEEGKTNGVTVVPGVELTCRIEDVDEVFLLALFPESCRPRCLEKLLLSWQVPPAGFGSGGFVIPRDVGTIIGDVRANGGRVISARADKTPFRRKAIPQLLAYGITLFDLVYPSSRQAIFDRQTIVPLEKLNFFTFSDAHEPQAVGSRFSEIELPAPTVPALLEKLG